MFSPVEGSSSMLYIAVEVALTFGQSGCVSGSMCLRGECKYVSGNHAASVCVYTHIERQREGGGVKEHRNGT